jgi:DNA repair protein RadA/Sms
MLRTAESQQNGIRKSVKQNPRYICGACDTTHEDYSLVCYACRATDTIVAIELDDLFALDDDNKQPRQRAKRALNVSCDLPAPMSTGRKAWDLVLGGGLIRPSSVLIPGPAGVGKSTCVLAMADTISMRLKRPVLYGSAEMPKEHFRGLCDRLKLEMKYLYVNDSGHAEDMHDDIAELKPVMVIWDSAQRFTVGGEFGEVVLRNVVRGAIESGNRVKATTLLLSHVTKEDDFMGPNGIGHDVDVIIHLRKVGQNMIEVATREKNRYAPTPLTATEALI